MGTIATEANKVKAGLNNYIEARVNNARDLFQSIVGKTRARMDGIMNGDVVGINENEIPNMQNAIKEYVADITTHLNNVKRDADTQKAFKGEYAVAITEFVDAVCEACDCVISNLLAFSDKLEEVRLAYKAKDEQMASDIRGQGAEIQSQFQRYNSGDAN